MFRGSRTHHFCHSADGHWRQNAGMYTSGRRCGRLHCAGIVARPLEIVVPDVRSCTALRITDAQGISGSQYLGGEACRYVVFNFGAVPCPPFIAFQVVGHR